MPKKIEIACARKKFLQLIVLDVIYQLTDIHNPYLQFPVNCYNTPEWWMCHEIILKINIQYAQVQQTRATSKAYDTIHSTYEYDLLQISERKTTAQFFQQ